MDLTFRLPGPWGSGKGANLQPTEVDNNFWELAQAIVDLQSNPAQPVGISSISVSGTQMTITLTDGSTMGPFTLPVLTFRWRGEWVPGAAYAELDVFSVLNTGIFMAVLDHISGATFDPDIAVDGEPALQQLFGSADASLSALTDVDADDVEGGDALIWDETAALWRATHLGGMAYQESNDVLISGGQIGGLPAPIQPGDAATKAYVDALPAGMMVADRTMMANISGLTGPALANTLSDFLDYALLTSARGTLLYRAAAGWDALAPGTAGLFLRTAGTGADPSWEVGASGVTSVGAGTGITTGGSAIVATGTVALAAIADNSFLANISGASTAPTPTTLTAYLDHLLGTARGTIITRTVGGWVSLAPGLTGQYLKALGSGADLVWDSPAGAGTVTSVASGSGLTGGPITGSGTLALAAIANNSVLANISGGSAAPGGATPSLLFDTVFGATQGSILYRNASAWVVLTPGTSGQLLTTAGAAANPSWQNAPTGASVASLRIVSNVSGGTAAPIGNTISAVFDAMLGSSRGMIIYRGAGGWSVLSPGTSGQLLQTGGTAGDPSWVTGASGGISDAPSDGTAYGRLNANWAGVAALASPTFSGTPAAPTAAPATNTTQIANTAFVQAAVAAGGAGINQLTGDATAGPGSGSQALTLAATAVAPGAYTNANITVDAKGRVTAASSGSSGGATPHPGYRSGVYYTKTLSAVGTNAAVTANRIYATPIFIASALTIDAVQIYVGTLASGSSGELGLYANSNGAVGSLVRDFGTVSTAGSTAQTITGFTQSVTAGWYFLAAAFSSTPSIISSAATDVSVQHLLGVTALISSFQGFQGWIANWTFAAGALPTNLTSPAQSNLSMPLVAFRVQ